MTVVIYVKEGCPYCQKVLDYIDEKETEDVEIYVTEKDFKTSTFKKKYGQNATFPRGYEVNGKKIKLIGGSGEIIGHLEESKK